ncbi:MAG: hypothetical protein ACE5HX_07890 [bacterium]
MKIFNLKQFLRPFFFFVCISSIYAQSPLSLSDRYALIIGGIGGQEEFTEKYFFQTSQMYDLLVDSLNYNKNKILYLFEKPGFDSLKINYTATAENVRRAFYQLGQTMNKQDQLFVFLVGHGSFDGNWGKFNLVGPDLKDIDFGQLFAELPTKKIILVNTASASGPFIKKLSGEGRVIITATKSGYEIYETNFADFFLDALGSDEADFNKDNRVSMLEAFKFARTRQDKWFEEKRQLRTEHPLLDDNGDGQGSQKVENSEDGLWASRVYLAPISPQVEAALKKIQSGTQSPTDSLFIQTIALEQQIEDLKAKKTQMKPAVYSQQLETLLIQLAKLNQQIKKLESNQNE